MLTTVHCDSVVFTLNSNVFLIFNFYSNFKQQGQNTRNNAFKLQHVDKIQPQNAINVGSLCCFVLHCEGVSIFLVTCISHLVEIIGHVIALLSDEDHCGLVTVRDGLWDTED